MNDVRRVSIYEDDVDYGRGETITDEAEGTHALIPWDEWENLLEKNKRLREALEEIWTGDFEYPSEGGDIARRALAETEEDK